jgi:hypothetical protein
MCAPDLVYRSRNGRERSATVLPITPSSPVSAVCLFVRSMTDSSWHENGKLYRKCTAAIDNGVHVVENASLTFFAISTTDSQDVPTGSTLFPLWMLKLLNPMTATTILKTTMISKIPRLSTQTPCPRIIFRSPRVKMQLHPSGNLSTTSHSPALGLRTVARHPLWTGSTMTNTLVHGSITSTTPSLERMSGNLPHFSTYLVYQCARLTISSS